MSVRGADVSSYQGHPDWSQAAKETSFAFCKATEGLTFRDPSFSHNWTGIEKAGLVRGAYHFAHADPGRSASAEAHNFLGYIRAHGGFTRHDIPVLDIEAGSLSGAALDNWINEWCRVVETAWRPGLIYSGAWYLGAKNAKVAGPRSRGWKLWVAAYGSQPSLFSGFTRWQFWQYTNGQVGPQPHTVAGIGHCDISVFDGTLADLHAYAGVKKPSPAYIAYLRGRLKLRRSQLVRVEKRAKFLTGRIAELTKKLRARGVNA
jgi:lysozyme